MWDKGQWGPTWFAMLCPEVRLWGWLTFWGTEPVLIALYAVRNLFGCVCICVLQCFQGWFFLYVKMVLLVRAMCMLDLCMTSFLVQFLCVFEHSFIVLIMRDKGQWGPIWFAMLCPEVCLWGWLTFWGTEPVLIALYAVRNLFGCVCICVLQCFQGWFFLCVKMVLLVRAMCMLDLCMTSFLVQFLCVFEHSFIVLIMRDKGQWGPIWFAMLCPEVCLWGWLTFWGTEPVLIALRCEELVWLCLYLCFTMLSGMIFFYVKKNGATGRRHVCAWLVHDKFPCDISFGL